MILYWDCGPDEETETGEKAITTDKADFQEEEESEPKFVNLARVQELLNACDLGEPPEYKPNNVVHNYAYLVDFEKDKIWAGDLLLDFGENNDFVVFKRETQEDMVEEIKCALSFKDGKPQILWEEVSYIEGVMWNVRKGIFWSKNLDLCVKVLQFFRKGKELFEAICLVADTVKDMKEIDKALTRETHDLFLQVNSESDHRARKAFLQGFYGSIQEYLEGLRSKKIRRNFRVNLILLAFLGGKKDKEETPTPNDSNQEDAIADEKNVGNETASEDSASNVPADEVPPLEEPQSRTSTLSILISKFLKFWKKLLNRLFK